MDLNGVVPVVGAQLPGVMGWGRDFKTSCGICNDRNTYVDVEDEIIKRI